MLESFRRHQRYTVAFLGVIAMLSFVVLPMVQQYVESQRGGGGNKDTKVIRFAGTELTQETISRRQYVHGRTLAMLQQVAQKVFSRQGTPKVPGFLLDRNGQIMRPGISALNEPAHVLQSAVLAHEARRQGFEISDETIDQWLNAYTDNRVTGQELNEIMREVSEGQIGRNQLYTHLREQLLADLMERMGTVGFAGRSGLSPSGRSLIVTPAESWRNFLKLNQAATITAYSMLVEDSLADAPKTFAESKIVALYEEAKKRYAYTDSSEPGFRRRYAADIEYVTGAMDQFLAKAQETLTEESLRAEYDKRAAAGRYTIKETVAPAATPPADAPASQSPPENAKPELKDEPKSDAPMPNEPKEEETKPEMKEEPSDSKPEEQEKDDQPVPEVKEVKPEEPKPDAPKPDEPTKPDEPKPEAPIPDEPKPNEPKPEEPAVTEEPKPDVETPEENEQSLMQSGRHFRLVALRPQELGDAVEEKPEVEQTSETDKPADDVDAAKGPETNPPPPADTTTERTRSFEEVRAELSREMAMPIAREMRQAALNKVGEKMNDYFFKDATYRSAIKEGKQVEPPETPDLKSLAKENGLEYVRTGLQDVVSIQNLTIARSMTGEMFQGEPFTRIAFTDETPKYYKQQTNNFFTSESFVFWKVADRADYVPTLDEAREEAIQALQLNAARELTVEKAMKLTAEAAKSDLPLKELVEETRRNLVTETIGPFTWMQESGMGGRPTISNIKELNTVGENFMKQVFSANVGDWSSAQNSPGTVVYVFKIESKSPDIEALRTQFLRTTDRVASRPLADSQFQQLLQGWYTGLEKELGLSDLELED